MLLLLANVGCVEYIKQGSHASWKVLDFFLENTTTWKVLESHFGPGKSWELKPKVLESPGKICLNVMQLGPTGAGQKLLELRNF